MPDPHAAKVTHPPAPHTHSDHKERRPLTGDDKVVICFSLLGLIGSVVLYRLRFPSVMVAVLLSAGITALVYRFLGGIGNATFTLGHFLKLGGTIAALVGIAYWADATNQLQPDFHLVSNDIMIGTWEWDYAGPNSSWAGNLYFTRDHGKLTFKGSEYNVEKVIGGEKRTLLYEMANGQATITNGNLLALESDVTDHQYNRKFHWKSVGRFVLIPAFVGELQPEKSDPKDPNLESKPYGMVIYKKAK